MCINPECSWLSQPLASCTRCCDLYRWLRVLWWAQMPAHTSFLHQSLFLSSAASPLSQLDWRMALPLQKQGTFLLLAWVFCALLLGSRAFQTFGWYLILALPYLEEKEGFYGSLSPERSEQNQHPLELQPCVAEGCSGAAPGAVWHNPDIVYWLRITWGIHT